MRSSGDNLPSIESRVTTDRNIDEHDPRGALLDEDANVKVMKPKGASNIS
jgi:hypothetical protein